jgi:hypothetical protein
MNLTYVIVPNIPGVYTVGNLTPGSFGLTYTESASDTYTDGGGEHSYTHYKLTGAFNDALTEIGDTFAHDGYPGYSHRYESSITSSSNFLVLEVIDHPPTGKGGGDEVRLIGRSGYSTVGVGWQQ